MNTPAVFVDTSFFFAVMDSKDVNHERALALAREFEACTAVSYVTWDVLSETATLLLYRSSPRAALGFLDSVMPKLRVVEIDSTLRAVALTNFRRFNGKRGPRISLCDAVTFTVIRTVLDGIPTATFDRGLRAIGLTTLPA